MPPLPQGGNTHGASTSHQAHGLGDESSDSENEEFDDARSTLSGIHPGYSCKEGRIVEDGLLVEFPCTPTRTRSVYSY
jgi:hypothetical protein